MWEGVIMAEKRTVDIHGKQYETVASRVERFRNDEQYKGLRIYTEIISNDSEYVIFKASILNDKDRVVATGHAQEKYGSNTINKTSALEVAETSAIGRALACLGLAGTEFASADEVAGAISQQASGTEYHPNGDPQKFVASPNKLASDKQKKLINNLYLQNGGEDGMQIDFIKGEGIDPENMTSADASKLIEGLQRNG